MDQTDVHSGLRRLLGRELIPTDPSQFNTLSDVPRSFGLSKSWQMSPRLEAVLIQVSKPYGTRTFCTLLNANIITVEQLCSTTAKELLEKRNCGKRSVDALSTALATFGLELARPFQPGGHDRFEDLSDAVPQQWRTLSPRLAAVINQLPNRSHRTRVANELGGLGVRTLAALCSAPLRSKRMLGPKTHRAVEKALSEFGLGLTEPPPSEKTLSPAQRRSSAVWLRQQISDYICRCDDTVTKNLKRAAKEQNPSRRDTYKARADCYRTSQRQLERIIAGHLPTQDRQR